MKLLSSPLLAVSRVQPRGLHSSSSFPRAQFFSKVFGTSLLPEKQGAPAVESNRCFIDEYVQEGFSRYLSEMGSTIPLNSYVNVSQTVSETPLFSHKTLFRFAGMEMFDSWEASYMRLINAIVESDIDVINEICEKNLAEKFERFLERLEKSQIEATMTTPVQPIVALEFQSHRIVEGVSMHRSENLHTSMYFQQSGKDSLIFTRLSDKKHSNWALFNLSGDKGKGGKKDATDLMLNQYALTLQTNIRLNLVRKQNPLDIVYGSDQQQLFSKHLIQVETERGNSHKASSLFTDLDGILAGNPFVLR